MFNGEGRGLRYIVLTEQCNCRWIIKDCHVPMTHFETNDLQTFSACSCVVGQTVVLSGTI